MTTLMGAPIPKGMKTCDVCGEQYQPRMSHQKRCSNECTKEARRLYQIEFSRKHKKPSEGTHKLTRKEMERLVKMNNKYLMVDLIRRSK